MQGENNDIDNLFREAFEQAIRETPPVNQAWSSMQHKLIKRRQKTFLLVTHILANFILFIGFIGFIKPMLLQQENNRETISAQQIVSEVEKSTNNIAESEHSNKEDIEITNEATFQNKPSTLIENNVSFSEIEVNSKIDEQKIYFEYKNLCLRDENLLKYQIYDEEEITKDKSDFQWTFTIGFLLHNHWVVGGDFMGNNLPSIGVLVSKNIKPNLQITAGARYLHRGNMDYAAYSKTKEIYDLEQINLYTLYVNGTHWLEIPIGVQYYLPNRKIFVGGYVTSDIFLHQTAELGVKTVVPAFSFQTEEQRKRAWNYESGIPKINFGIRVEAGVYLNPKSSINIFSKVSPYSGAPNANIQRNYGWDLGVDWRYYF
ncbi:hypothetical protein JCM31826_00620 [Thermaurantimonas aggregans]|uniref:Outer membrane protein beta-barrel domain-containing protein n=1 Tax=Thermaurantimonas aggregans TaxID=2173829 RepID=A0A401XHT8_9FLAO|nr:hypothetical protein [Thermaurantimonas aggregans]MCX8149433.1 hypothetical protein [Thermaurantimonas aggregans]GCD76580.1 hypothetical protein JCM31826_00620 [Thermaurantimonas aggregans]